MTWKEFVAAAIICGSIGYVLDDDFDIANSRFRDTFIRKQKLRLTTGAICLVASPLLYIVATGRALRIGSVFAMLVCLYTAASDAEQQNKKNNKRLDKISRSRCVPE